MRVCAILICSILIASCEDRQESPYKWHDDQTGCDFLLDKPSDNHHAMWLQTYETARTLWPETPCPISVTILEEPNDLIYFDGRWRSWPSGRAGFARIRGKRPALFVAGYYPDEFIPLIMAHELVHIVWHLDNHSDIFWQRNEELLAAMGIL